MRILGWLTLVCLLLSGCQRTPAPPPRRSTPASAPQNSAPQNSASPSSASAVRPSDLPAPRAGQGQAGGSAIATTPDTTSAAGEAQRSVASDGRRPAENAGTAQAARSGAETQRAATLSADRQCAECHADLVTSYAQHPMGRSLAAVDQAATVESFQETAANPFERDGYRYRVVREQDAVWHERERLDAAGEVLGREREAVHWAVGSGHHGRSYLMETSGRLRMSPLTWYPQRQRWDLSPGYASSNFGFQRPITEDCLYCHANRVSLVAGEMNAYHTPVFAGHAAISCERCHGAGDQHVAARRADPGSAPADAADPTIVNPARLASELRESVCQQCHVSGAARVVRQGHERWDYQPGEVLQDTLRLYTVAAVETAQEEFVGQAEQMVLSRCYEGSNGQLGCISCHDPHQLPAAAERVEFYRERCLTCHAADDCELPTHDSQRLQVSDSCYECHMPRRATALQHVATTNHQIPRRRAIAEPGTGDSQPRTAEGSANQVSRAGPVGGLPIREFPPRDSSATGVTWDRDLAMAVIGTLGTFPDLIEQRHVSTAAVELARAVQQQPQDIDAWQALAEAYWRLQRLDKARQALQGLLQQSPQHEYGLATLANIDKQQQRWAQVEATYRQLAARDPHQARYRFEWAYSLSQLGQWDSCERAVAGALQQFPLHVGLRQLQVAVDVHFGRQQEATAAMELLRRWQPAELPEIEAWYTELTSK